MMVKQSPSRNHRSKGVKVKHVLQVCVLLAVCFWLIYQVKHSHNKKKALDEHDPNISLALETHIPGETVKFGRKDLQPQLDETITKNNKLDEEAAEEEENGGEDEEEEKKHEAEEQEEDNKTAGTEDEGTGSGDDDIDEDDQEKSEIEIDREEDFLDDEKEREEGVEKEAEGKGSEDKEGQNEIESSLEDHEAREENYRGDDASSAVTHETEDITAETERGRDNSNENPEEEVKSNDTAGLKAEEKGEISENGISPNMTGKEDKGSEIGSFKSEGSSLLNYTMTTESNIQTEVGNIPREGSSESNDLLLLNRTEMKPDATDAQNATFDNQSDPNMMISAIGESSNSSTTTEFAVSEKVVTPNTTVEVEGDSGSLTTEQNTDATQGEKSETSDGTDKSLDSSETGNKDVIQHDRIDSSDSSIPLEEKDVRTDIDTLPEIITVGSNNEDTAAE